MGKCKSITETSKNKVMKKNKMDNLNNLIYYENPVF